MNEIYTRYITSKMFGHTSAERLMQLKFDVLEEWPLPVEKFATNISIDSENITKSLNKKFDSKIKESYLYPGLLQFKSCNLHKSYNASQKGKTIYG